MPADETRAELCRLIDAAHSRVVGLVASTSAVQLYLDAARVAEQRIPGPVGTAVAGVLAVAAESRRLSGLRGVLGESEITLALAVAVLGMRSDTPKERA
jgi:hypothetical protein